MAIERNGNKCKNENNGNRWRAENEWVVDLGNGEFATFPPGKKAVDSVKVGTSICNMLRKCHELVENKSKNLTVNYRFNNGQVSVVGFLNRSDIEIEQLQDLEVDAVSKAMTANEMEAEWNEEFTEF